MGRRSDSYLSCKSNSTLTTAPRASTPAAMARPTSSPLIFLAADAATGAGRGATPEGAAGAAGRGAPVEVGGRIVLGIGAPGAEVGGRGAGGAGVGTETLGAPAAGEAGAPPTGIV